MYKLINFITKYLSFPVRGRKYVQRWMHKNNLDKRYYDKRIGQSLFLKVLPTDHIDQLIFWYGEYEPDVRNALMKLIREDSVVFDIGANIGYFTIIAASKAKHGKVHAFEPSTSSFNRLVANVEGNGLKNVKCIRTAIGNVSEPRLLYLSSVENTGMTSLTKPENYSGDHENVQVITLDEYVEIEKVTRLDVVKIDIEGNELNALKGMRKCLSVLAPHLIIELNPSALKRFSTSAKDIADLLHGYGYLPYSLAGKKPLMKIPDEEMNVMFSKVR